MSGTAFPFPPIDWQVPWLAPYRDAGQRVWGRWAAGAALAEALNAERIGAEAAWPALAAVRLRFVPQAALPAGQAYEAFIHARAEVPTRDNLHDFFNGLVWLRFPGVKRHLNAQHAAQWAREAGAAAPAPGRRGAVRDALTLFDENAAVWQAPDVLGESLARRDWPALFLTHRAAWRDAVPILMGHALLEKLCVPRKGITAHVWRVPPGVPLEAGLLAGLQPEALTRRPWCPLPVLGVPGWWPGNEVPGFYADPMVFRPAVR